MAQIRLQSPNRNELFTLPELFTVGRLESNTLCLDDDLAVSREHAEIRTTDSGYLLTDLQSRNGTYVERGTAKLRVSGTWRLEPGDVIHIGSARLTLEVPEADRISADGEVTFVPGTTVHGRILPEPRPKKEE